MSHAFYDLCLEPLALSFELAAGVRVEGPDVSRQRLQSALAHLVSEGRRRGFSGADLAEARYALVALIDEQLLEADWQGRLAWMKQPLQLVLYHENAAGEQFFVRLRALLESGERRPALLAHHLCLSLGFRGVYRHSGDEQSLRKFARATERRVAKWLLVDGELRRTTAAPPAVDHRRLRLSLMSAGAALAVIVVLGFGSLVRAAGARCVAKLESARPALGVMP